MSNKEKNLQKNLCKTLTEYLLYDNKNSSRSLETAQETILDQLATSRMETALPIALHQDAKYQKAQKKCTKANEKIQELNLTPQQWHTVDAAITAENISSIEYIRVAYKQGVIDIISLLKEAL